MAEGSDRIPGIILAGGLSRRMGGGDKGLRELGGKPLIMHVAERLSQQASPIAINANGDASRFARFGLPVISDVAPDHAGPLAGVLAGMRWAKEAIPEARFIVTAACDTPFFPMDLVTKFLLAPGGTHPAIVLAKSAGQIHPVFGLWSVALADDLMGALASGTRKVSSWAQEHSHFTVEFPLMGVDTKLVDSFFNANTPDELAEAEAFLALKIQAKLRWMDSTT
jgi:molybdopterin-guanine dinucleotide biosynthesis protein A